MIMRFSAVQCSFDCGSFIPKYNDFLSLHRFLLCSKKKKKKKKKKKTKKNKKKKTSETGGIRVVLTSPLCAQAGSQSYRTVL